MRETLLEWVRVGGLVVSVVVVAKLTHLLVAGAVSAYRSWALAVRLARRAAARKRGER